MSCVLGLSDERNNARRLGGTNPSVAAFGGSLSGLRGCLGSFRRFGWRKLSRIIRSTNIPVMQRQLVGFLASKCISSGRAYDVEHRSRTWYAQRHFIFTIFQLNVSSSPLFRMPSGGWFFQVSYKDFKRVENEVSEWLKDGHERIENAEKAQRRAHGSLENPHHRTSASSVSGKTFFAVAGLTCYLIGPYRRPFLRQAACSRQPRNGTAFPRPWSRTGKRLLRNCWIFMTSEVEMTRG